MSKMAKDEDIYLKRFEKEMKPKAKPAEPKESKEPRETRLPKEDGKLEGEEEMVQTSYWVPKTLKTQMGHRILDTSESASQYIRRLIEEDLKKA